MKLFNYFVVVIVLLIVLISGCLYKNKVENESLVQRQSLVMYLIFQCEDGNKQACDELRNILKSLNLK